MHGPASEPTLDGSELSDLERDALTELANVGVSHAAAGLRKMVGEEVLLSVPSAQVVGRRTAAALIGEREDDELVAVRQGFAGAFSGRAMLIFPQSNGLHLVRAVLGDAVDAAELAAMETEALAETGNVILNGCLATMANMLREPLSMSLPEVVRGSGARLFEVQDAADGDAEGRDGQVLFLFINFMVRQRDVRGYIAMLMDLSSMAALRRLIGAFIDSVMGEGAGPGR
jgi:chemotaxis protein CheC